MPLADLRGEVWRANQALVEAGLVTLSFGNASGVDRAAGVMLIKPSGVPYAELQPKDIVAVSLLDGRTLDGALRPSLDTPTHLALYRRYPQIGGIVHTHSIEATAWAQAGRPLPPLGTTHADYFNGSVPATRQMTAREIEGEYEAETGQLIIETLEREGLDPLEMPAVLVASHGPFTWGKSATEAVENAIVLELLAATATRTLALRPDLGPMGKTLRKRHFWRKHGPAAYYGQRRRRPTQDCR